MHLPLRVHAAVNGDDAPAVPLAAACALLWAGAELHDNLTDGDLAAPWQQSAPFEVVFTATAIGALLGSIGGSELARDHRGQGRSHRVAGRAPP